MRSTSGGYCVAASTRTLRSVIQCDGMVTTLMAEVGARRRPPPPISTVASLLVSTEGPHRRFGVPHQLVHSWLHGQPPDV